MRILILVLGLALAIGLLVTLFRFVGPLRLLSFAAIIAGVVLFIISMRDSSASAIKRFVIPIGCVVLGVLLLVLPRIFHGGPVGMGFLPLLGVISFVAGIVLFILGMRNPSASPLKRVVIPVICVVLAVLLFVLPMIGSGAGSSDDKPVVREHLNSSAIVEINYEPSDEVVTTWCSFTSAYDGMISVYTISSDGKDYAPAIWIYNEDLSYADIYNDGWCQNLIVESGRTYYIATYFVNTSFAQSVYEQDGKASYSLCVEFEGDPNYLIVNTGATGIEYVTSGVLNFYDNAKFYSYQCTNGESFVASFRSSEHLLVRLYDENFNLIQDGNGTEVNITYNADRDGYVYFMVTTYYQSPGYIYLTQGYDIYFEVAVENN